MLRTSRELILRFIDFFHKPFARWIDIQTFRYLACGGSNQLLGIFIYGFTYNFILDKQDVSWFGLHITARIATYIIAFCVTFPIGFSLSKYVVFQESNLKGRVQLFRYAVLTGICIILNYIFLKLFALLGVYPTPSFALTTVIVAVFSYIAQRNFTFKVKGEMDMPAYTKAD